MPANLKITVAQLNPTVGDILTNTQKIRETYLESAARSINLVIAPELSITGYPLEDLANNRDLLDTVETALEVLKETTRNHPTALIVGAPVRHGDKGVYNAAVILGNGELLGVVHKKSLPNYGVFDEVRNFIPEAKHSRPVAIAGVQVGVLICEDVWHQTVAHELKENGAQVLVSVSASPFRPDVLQTRVRDVAAHRVAETGLPLVYVNCVGGQDEVVFDGGSFILDDKGRRLLQLPQWEECCVDFSLGQSFEPTEGSVFPGSMEEIYCAMMLGLGDYVRKSGFTDVVLGLSGGIDSALVAAVAGDALGAEHVHCVRLPSQFTSDLSNNSAEEMCKTWGFSMNTVPISGVVQAADIALGELSAAGLKKLTVENMQARARGYLLMTISNDRNWLLLSTGNKSEIAVGYATLYGDMCGGFNPLKDVFKTTVFSLAKWRNSHHVPSLKGPEGVVIPQEIIDRPPSAELSPGQLDTDSLPPYPVLDAILTEMVEHETPVSRIAEKGFAPEVVDRVYRMLKRAEYKRRQGAPGPKTSLRGFTRDRRIPIVNGFDTTMRASLLEMLDEPL